MEILHVKYFHEKLSKSVPTLEGYHEIIRFRIYRVEGIGIICSSSTKTQNNIMLHKTLKLLILLK